MGNVKEDSYFETDAKYGKGIAINVYKEEYSIVSAMTRDDDIWMEWCFPAKGKVPGEKMFPWKISLGTRDLAIITLKRLLAVIERSGPPTREPGDDDIAF